MSDNNVSVTITPKGIVRDVTLGGVSIGRFIPAGALRLDLSAGNLPVLSFELTADEIIVKGPAS